MTVFQKIVKSKRNRQNALREIGRFSFLAGTTVAWMVIVPIHASIQNIWMSWSLFMVIPALGFILPYLVRELKYSLIRISCGNDS